MRQTATTHRVWPQRLFLLLVFGLPAGCVAVQPWGPGTPPSDLPGGGTQPTTAPAGAVVSVDYEVSCTHCDVHFTNARGEQQEVEDIGGNWRRSQRVSSGYRSVTLSVFPSTAEDRVRAARISLDGQVASETHLPPGGSEDPVHLSAYLVGPPDLSPESHEPWFGYGGQWLAAIPSPARPQN